MICSSVNRDRFIVRLLLQGRILPKNGGGLGAQVNKNFASLISSENVWSVLDRVVIEVGSLLRWKIGSRDDANSKGMPAIPTLSFLLGESEAVIKAFIEYLDESRWLAVSQAVPLPKVKFIYKGDGHEIAFEKASEGQRAAVLLAMLLKQSGGPLIIDQPENDLDNSVVTKVVELLHRMKENRQLLVATHNANLVVNGAAELVAVMSNDSSGKRVIAQRGAIDDIEVRLAITQTMEGGEKAFKDRQRKYGF